MVTSLEQYLDIADIMFVELDDTGNVLLINKKGCDILGCKQEDILGKNWFENFIPERYRTEVKKVHEQLMTGTIESVEYYENPILTKNKKESIIAWHNTILKDSNGEIRGTLSSGEDITEKKKVEEELRESEEKFRHFFENEPDYCYMISTKRIILDINKSALKTLGYKKSEILGKPLNVIYSSKSHDKMKKLLGEWKTNGKLQDEEMIIQTKKGDERIVHLSASCMKNEDGEIVHSISVQKDITEWKKAETELRKTAGYLDMMGDALIVIDDKTNTIRVNQAFTKTWEYTADEVVNKPVFMLFPEKELSKHKEKMGVAAKTNDIVIFKTTALTKSNKEIPISVNGICLKNEKGIPKNFIASFRDISKIKKSEKELRFLSSVVEQSSEGIAIADLEGSLLFVNPAWTTMHGYDDYNKLIGKHLKLFHSKEQLEQDVIPFNKKVMEKGYNSGEIGHIRKDGTKFPTLMSTTIIKDENENPIAIAGIAKDITEIKKSRDELREREQFLTSIIENIPDMIFIKDAEELRFVRFNKAGEELLGYKREDLIGKNDYDFFPKEQADFFVEKDRKVLESGGVTDIPEEPIDTKKGKRILHTKKMPIVDKEGKPIYLLGISEDITERKKAEEENKKRIDELERFQKLSVGREMKMMELKKKLQKIKDNKKIE